MAIDVLPVRNPRRWLSIRSTFTPSAGVLFFFFRAEIPALHLFRSSFLSPVPVVAMVSFVCNYCQDTIKKPKLDQHFNRCPNASYSCVDCSVDFYGTEYRSHVSCISEAEKYQKSLYKGPKVAASAQKGGQQNNGKQQQKQEKPQSIVAELKSAETEEKTTKEEKVEKRKSEASEEKATKKSKKNKEEAKEEGSADRLRRLTREIVQKEKSISLKSLQKKLIKKLSKEAALEKDAAEQLIAKEFTFTFSGDAVTLKL
ncbi:hypothetical protein THASP1DRAFT_22551 [Thamnocephalis sphaerospora]|uniref:Zinc finger C2H2 LYAR-type domain-containing protein n=1 Tax=Thamnocephalis sphaerospora TaxID=78915 RepID=A0A4P9XUJ4_9FUNG|nr:hypothetical protein THASP1DRAFT_22551 [Thamnocephalis sphaerospora]|eukprot:RKP09632.1 hypothetical protein THASP1DRAFT_22551 [Thamnocephalis sphaerospora]